MKPRYPLTAPMLGRDDEREVTRAIRSGWLTHSGKYVAEFEGAFAAFSGGRYGVATSSGTAALHLALNIVGVGPGDEVIVPALTYVATASAVTYARAAPVFVDVERETWCVDPVAVQQAITPRTKALFVVHLYGQPAKMNELNAVARERGIVVIADAAQAHGSLYRKKGIASTADITVFSFHGSKLVTTGEGGMLVTRNPAFAQRTHFLANHAADSSRPYWHGEIGFNYRLTNIQAALGVSQLKKVRKALIVRQRIDDWYREFLGNRDDLELNPIVKGTSSNHWMVCVLLPHDGPSVSTVRSSLERKGIETRPFFSPVHAMPPFAGYRAVGDLPVTTDLAARGLALPTGSHLTKRDVRVIANALLGELT
jgi:perosamine synthetase